MTDKYFNDALRPFREISPGLQGDIDIIIHAYVTETGKMGPDEIFVNFQISPFLKCIYIE